MDKKKNVAFFVAGYPSLKYTEEILLKLDESVIDILELGLPYRDPIADGEIIAGASFKASLDGVNARAVFDLLEKTPRKKPVFLMVYFNIIFIFGLKKFVNAAKKAGVAGLIVPDLPFEENLELFLECQKNDIALVPLVAPTSNERTEKILSRASGFVYAVGSIGITGGKVAPKQCLQDMVQNIKKYSNLPVFIGFGIKDQKTAAQAKSISDGVIIGSKIVELCAEFDSKELLKKLNDLF